MSQTTTFDEVSAVWAGLMKDGPSTASQFDYELAQRVARGDMQAFEEFYERYHGRVYSLCLRMIKNVAEAEDLTQEIFIHVYHKIGTFRGESAMKTWLHRVTINRILMHFRKNTARREHTTEDGEAPEPVVKRTEIQRQTPLLDRIALDRAIARLPPGYRAVFVLHDVEGYEHSEIARICGISVGTSKSQLHKSRRKLCELLQPASVAALSTSGEG